MIRNPFTYLALCIVFCCGSFCHSDEKKSAGFFEDDDGIVFDDNRIIVTPQQRDAFDAIEEKYNTDFYEKFESLSDLTDQARDMKAAYFTDVEKILTAEQRKTVYDSRLARMREQVDTDMQYLKEFSEFGRQVANAETMVVYEGLPRGSEHEIEDEKRAHKTIEINNFNFYAEPRTVEQPAADQLRTIASNYRSFRPFSGVKGCGKFNPDVCLRFEFEGKSHDILICFGCGEVLLVRPADRFVADIDSVAFQELFQISRDVCPHLNLRKKSFLHR